ncbi:MAG: acyl-CoA dehydrogenase family protein [Vulcanimicrobiota bacterium]
MESFRQQLRARLEGILAPRLERIERDQSWQAQTEALSELGEHGYLAMLFADSFPGAVPGRGLVATAVMSEELAYLNYAFETTVASTLSCAKTFYDYAPDGLKQRYLPGILRGSEVSAIGMTEPQAGSDAAAMKTRLEVDGDHYVITGFKRYISNAGVASSYLVYGLTDPAQGAARGMTAVVVPADTPGLSCPRTYSFMGRNGSVVGEVKLEGCRVPATNVLGQVGGGFKIMLSMLNFERILVGASSLGVARSAFDEARRHAQQRHAFGQPLGSKQLIWSRIADMSWRIDSARALTYAAARCYDEGARGKALMKEAATAKLVGSEAAGFCADAAVQILGGDGLTKEYGRVEQIYRDARALTIAGGTSEMVRYLIARTALPDIALNL